MQSFFSMSLNTLALAFLVFGFSSYVSCLTPATASEDKALQQIRQATKKGELPPESMVVQIENSYPNTRTAALARLVRARIKLKANDFPGAAALLDNNIFKQKTTVADYAMWMRGRALRQAARFADSQKVFEQLVKEYPNSLHIRDARIGWADAAYQQGQALIIPAILQELTDANDAEALLLTARSYEFSSNNAQAIAFYRRTYFYGAGTAPAKEAEAKLTALASPPTPQNADEASARAERLFQNKSHAESAKAYSDAMIAFPALASVKFNFQRGSALAMAKRPDEAAAAFAMVPQNAPEKPETYNILARAYGTARNWMAAKQTTAELVKNFPNSPWAPKTLGALGAMARDAKNKVEESYFFSTAMNLYLNAVEVAQAQFELAWLQHEANNFTVSSQMLTEHLARYANKDTTNRGRAGYWAGRDSERAGKIAEACVLYEAMTVRYDANWYGHLSLQRLTALKNQGQCRSNNFAADSLVMRAAANLKTVTVAPETATAREDARVQNADQLGVVGLFDWALDELGDAAKTAPGSPRVNMAMARFHRQKDDNVSAFLALAKSYPDYGQMKPEEMSQEEWEIFYPLLAWNDIRNWATQRQLDPYQVAGLIRQESVFQVRAKSHANAYGLMQLLIPTARMTAKKFNSATTVITADSLFQPALNIELGTAYMREQLDKYGRIEYMAVAYNAGPGRVPQWRSTLPIEIDEFVEAIPFKETKGYVQGITRNRLQYQRLYDMNGQFKSNVGSRPLRGMIDSMPAEQFAQEMPDVKVADSAGEE